MSGSTRVLLVLVGLFILGRTFSKNSTTGETLVDQLLNLGKNNATSSSTSSGSASSTGQQITGSYTQTSAAQTAAAAATLRKTNNDPGISVYSGGRFKVAGA